MASSAKDTINKGNAFHQEIYGSLQASRKRAWIVAGATTLIAILAMIAVVIILPLKSVETVVIAVDQTTGYMEQTHSLKQRGAQLSQEEKVIKYELMRYLTAREGYFHPVQQQRYKLVMAMSEGQAADEFAALWDVGNSDNPSVIYSNKGTIDVKVKSIVIDGNVARIRFQRSLKFRKQLVVSHWIAVMTFTHHLERNQNMRDIAQNPLSFTVTAYRLEEENV